MPEAATPLPKHATMYREAETVELRYLFHTLFHRKILITLIVLAAVFGTLAFVNMIPKRYTATATLAIEESAAPGRPATASALFSARSFDSNAIMTEVKLLRSPAMAQKVIKRLNLAASPPFLEGLNQLTDLSLTSQFIGNLSINLPPRSNLIEIEYTSPSPALSAQIANTLSKVYLEEQLDEKVTASKRNALWLKEQLAQLREKIQSSGEELQQYQRTSNQSSGVASATMAQQISRLQIEIEQSKARLNTRQTQLETIWEDLNQGAETLSLPPELQTKMYQQLSLKASALEQQMAELSSRYGPKHPSFINKKAEIKSIKRSLQEETSRIIQKLESDIQLGKSRLVEMEKDLEKTQQNLIEGSISDISLLEIEREVTVFQNLYQKLLEKYKTAQQQYKFLKADARVVSVATPPLSHSFPNKSLALGLAFILSLTFAIILSFMLDALDQGFKTVQDVNDSTGRPILGMIPRLPRLRRSRAVDYVIEKPFSEITESVRLAFANLSLLTDPDGASKVINITSSTVQEGKTTFAVWLGRIAAQAGLKVILIDCDVRNPSLHQVFPHLSGYSLTDLLTDTAPQAFKGHIAVDGLTSMHMIFSGQTHAETVVRMTSPRMEVLLEALKEKYDLIILDSPPALGTADSRLLSRMSDETLYLIHPEKTPKEAALAGLRSFHDFNIKLTGTVLTHLKPGARL